jgi:hypothetical protein
MDSKGIAVYGAQLEKGAIMWGGLSSWMMAIIITQYPLWQNSQKRGIYLTSGKNFLIP